jgi:hypothetical protein
MRPGDRLRLLLWSAVIFLALFGVAVAVRRIVYLVPILIRGYSSPVVSNSGAAQFVALDEVFARHPVLTMIHIVPGLLFMILGPLQFSTTIRARHLQWHRLNGRVFLGCHRCFGADHEFRYAFDWRVNQAAATVLFGTFFLFALCKAYRHIRHREVSSSQMDDTRLCGLGLP